MQEDELKQEEKTSLNENGNNEFVLNEEARKAIFKSHFKYYLTNGFLIFIPMVVTIIIYFKINNIDFDWKVLLSTFWNILRKPVFFVPVIIAIFVKDILKYIFCGMSKDDIKYIQEAEKENPKTEGISEVLNAKTTKKRFAFISLLFGLVGILFYVLIRQILNLKTLISFAISYFYSAHKFALPYSDFQHIILNKTFLIVFFVSLCIMNIFFKKKKNESEQSTENAVEITKEENN